MIGEGWNVTRACRLRNTGTGGDREMLHHCGVWNGRINELVFVADWVRDVASLWRTE